jgi:hypothetical protein
VIGALNLYPGLTRKNRATPCVSAGLGIVYPDAGMSDPAHPIPWPRFKKSQPLGETARKAEPMVSTTRFIQCCGRAAWHRKRERPCLVKVASAGVMAEHKCDMGDRPSLRFSSLRVFPPSADGTHERNHKQRFVSCLRAGVPVAQSRYRSRSPRRAARLLQEAAPGGVVPRQG